MTPQRWRDVEDLYHAALDRAPTARAALLAQADPELRREVESLLAQEAGKTPLSRPAWEGAASLARIDGRADNPRHAARPVQDRRPSGSRRHG
jgi:hypothetical protein